MSFVLSSVLRGRVAAPLIVLCLGACSSHGRTQPASNDGPVNAPAIQPAAQSAAVSSGETSVADRLTLWLSLTGSSHASAQEYANFLQTRPVWPRWSLLQLRMQQALTRETDASVLQQLCASQSLTYSPALVKCVTTIPSLAGKLLPQARQAWINGTDSAQAAVSLAQTFPQAVTAETSWKRFNREETSGKLVAARQTLTYLAPSAQALAQARLAFRAGDPGAEATLAGLSASDQADTTLVYDRLHWLRLQKRDDEALALWKNAGVQAEEKTHLSAFWRERDALSRDFLQNNQNTEAFWVADDKITTGVNRLDAAFLSGWIALQKLNMPSISEPLFRSLADSSSLITKSRGYYWLGRTHARLNQTASAQADYARAAGYAGTFYGQMAAAELDGKRPTLLNPDIIPAAVTRSLRAWQNPMPLSAAEDSPGGNDLARAAEILVSWNDRPHARDFLSLMLIRARSLREKVAIAHLATRLQIPDTGVMVARYAGRDGLFLLREGWPQPYTLPTGTAVSPALVQGLIRQESSFNPDAVSPSNAIGLMQLKTGTAHDMLQSAGLPASAATAGGLHNPDNNMRLGMAYLSYLQGRFASVVPYVTASYNGGPNRLARWLSAQGNPAESQASQDDMIDWIETIPYGETRNYVQRVWENMTIYSVLGKNT
ncbi:lytic transglycosylase domain-containing protein [Acetobacter thailandicus]|uniref:lytic transglycosylase domain-containing protein n=1 Tax=Acetobacter thailandicus TaxID=1502842 RepID=UPI001BA4A866|nr:lytic transglycosylase domain-containing protein [Acetobacter thailandicus]MBS0979895.1 lytic transglycosylase domain-containing protein [Acetobacter thailandicus]